MLVLRVVLNGVAHRLSQHQVSTKSGTRQGRIRLRWSSVRFSMAQLIACSRGILSHPLGRVDHNPITHAILFEIPAFKRQGKPPRETRARVAPRNDAGGPSAKVNLTDEDTLLAHFKLYFDDDVIL